VLLHKPRGVYATNVAQGVQKRAIDLLPKDFPRVYPVGRLDADSKGLLLLTNDGELTNQLTHPRYGIAKTFRATVEGSIAPGAIEDLERGVWLADKEGGKGYKTAPSRIKVLHRDRESTVLEITLREGRNRQAYRMLAKLGKVKDLTRTRIGPLTLDRLPSGEFRLLTPREVRELRQFVAEKTSRVSGQKPLARKHDRPRRKAGGARTEASRAR
jgi:23S rRNA pseudouridine2605 synthase